VGRAAETAVQFATRREDLDALSPGDALDEDVGFPNSPGRELGARFRACYRLRGNPKGDLLTRFRGNMKQPYRTVRL
jgi:hypothetical protein